MKSARLITALSTLLLTACSTAAPQLQGFQNTQQFSAFNNRTQTSDWHANLSPELQNYYGKTRGLKGDALFKEMNRTISRGQRTIGYKSAKSYLYATADHVEQGNRSGLFTAYSNVFIDGKGGNGNSYREKGDQNRDGKAGDFVNAEHTWPQSFFKKRAPMVSDMHHIFPTLSRPNGMRNNFPIGMATGVVVYTTSSGSKLGVIDKTGRHNPEDIKRWYNMPWNQQPHDIMFRDLQPVFEPASNQKGNTARAMLYFYLRYYNEGIKSHKGYNEKEHWDSKVATYIRWSQEDPVDAQERRRHELIARQQGNRNPFIDIPNLAQEIGERVFVEDPKLFN